LHNFGSQSITSVSIHYKIEGGTLSNYSWTGSLGTGGSVDVTLPAITASGGLHSFICYTSNPNGNPEGYTYNDTATSSFIVNTSDAVTLPFSESFDGDVFPPEGWALNSSSVYSWGRTSLATYSSTGSAVKANYLDNSYSNWDLDMPLLNIGDQGSPVLSFTYAYARYPGYPDTLIVSISADCGNTWQNLFYKGGFDLATVPQYFNQPFYPKTPDQWRTEVIPLSGYIGNVLIKFRDVNGNGNHLYLDDVKVDFPTAKAENKPTVNFLVYPNPAYDAISVSGLPINSEILIMDLTGKHVMKQNMSGIITTIDIQKLPQGVYILRSSLGIRKIVKM
jgi:hypothetical protein